ncbi:hypothetical protein BVRB_2g038220 [Beta vulgaris subsp. vulgaris]|nr:hypothetical protein BVRB_2g038220 [Beta vulgaris subsp. vulgaris]
MALSSLLPRFTLFLLSPSPKHPTVPNYPRSCHFSLGLNGNSQFKKNSSQFISGVRAFNGWKEYEEAVKEKDLARALKFLKSIDGIHIQPDEETGSPIRTRPELGLPLLERDWEVLDTCLNADDMRLVSSAYVFLKDRGVLPNFGKCRNLVLEGPRNVTPTILKSSTGLEVSKLSPKKWGISGASSAVLFIFLGGVSYLLSQGIDLRPNLATILGLALVDSVFLGGSCLAQISSYWPPYKRRILVHEAGHLLTAYLMGCPIRGVILDPIVAMQMGIQGQAGTQFWDENLEKELAGGRLSSTAFDRYCIVLFAGIAAEALVYGEAEGGENDENLFRGICVLLQPPLNVPQMSNQARWAVLQSYNLLKWHKQAHKAAVKALESGSSLSSVIRSIEDALSTER